MQRYALIEVSPIYLNAGMRASTPFRLGLQPNRPHTSGDSAARRSTAHETEGEVITTRHCICHCWVSVHLHSSHLYV